MSPFGVDVAGILAAELGPGMDAATLTVVTAGVRDPDNLSAGTNATEIDYECRGQVTDDAAEQFDATLVQKDDRVVTILLKTLGGGTVKPKPNDKVTATDAAGTTREYSVVKVKTRVSHYDCLVRG
jgi:hypothetical protein